MNDFNPDPSAEFTRQVPTCPASGGGLPEGGEEGQTLVKQSTVDGDAIWGYTEQDWSHSGFVGTIDDGTFTVILDVAVDAVLSGLSVKLLYYTTDLTLRVNGNAVSEVTSLTIDSDVQTISISPPLEVAAGSTITFEFASSHADAYGLQYTLKMSYSVPEILGEVEDALYWGFSTVWPGDFHTLTPGQVLAVMSALDRTLGSALPDGETKLLCSSTDPTLNYSYPMFAYPDSWGELDSVAGIQYADGDVGSPTDTVDKYPSRCLTPRLFGFNRSIAGFYANPTASTVDANGWACVKRYVGNTLYRFYTFGVIGADTNAGNLVVTPEYRERTGNVATLKHAALENNGLGQNKYLISVTGAGGTGYNVTDELATQPTMNTFSFPSTGADEAETADVGWAVTYREIGIVAWSYGYGTTVGGQAMDRSSAHCSLFITKA